MNLREQDETLPGVSAFPAIERVTSDIKPWVWQAQNKSDLAQSRFVMADPGTAAAVAAALAAAGVALAEAHYARGLAHAAAREADLRTRNPTWGRTRIYPEGSLMDRWLDTPGASKWRTLLGPEDRRRLHEAGFTDPLVRAGFETDPDWWRA
jgi:hypothetical protein